MEQLRLERLAEEYAKVAKEEISDNTKLSVLLRVVKRKKLLPVRMLPVAMPGAPSSVQSLLVVRPGARSRSDQNLQSKREGSLPNEPRLHGDHRPTESLQSPRTMTREMRPGKEKGGKGKGRV